MRLLMKGGDNNTNREEEREKKMHVNAYYTNILQAINVLYMSQQIYYKIDNPPYFFKYLVCNI